MSLARYGNTAGLNSTTGTGTMQEGIAPSLVNDRYRELLADLRLLINEYPWVEVKSLGQAFNETGFIFDSSNSITDSSGIDLTQVYKRGRRIRCVGSVTGDIVGTITDTAFSSPNNTVTISFDSGSLTNEALQIFLGPNLDEAFNATISRQVFTSSGTWNKPAGLRRANVICIGAGGGSGSATGGGGEAESGGAGAGGVCIKVFGAGDLGSTETVTVGVGGTGGVGGNGTNGGNSSFDSLTANGGSGSVSAVNTTGDSVTAGATGGTATGGDINITGQAGHIGRVAAGRRQAANMGGSSGLGYGIGGVSDGQGSNQGTGFGAGASGSSNSLGSNANGNDGRDGLVIVEEYFT